MPKKRKPPVEGEEEATKPVAVLNSYQQVYEEATVHRSELKNAPYNPRKIVESARHNLKHVIATRGMVEPFVWNARTGHLVGGHQRLSVLDSLQGSPDYLVKVARLDVDEKTERELNLALNNPSIQGDWDLEKLEAMLPGVDLEGAGFNLQDVYKVFGFSPLMDKPEELAELAERIRGVKERHRESQKKKSKANPDDARYFRTLVFASVAEAEEWAVANGFDPRERFYRGRGLKVVRDEVDRGNLPAVSGVAGQADAGRVEIRPSETEGGEGPTG